MTTPSTTRFVLVSLLGAACAPDVTLVEEPRSLRVEPATVSLVLPEGDCAAFDVDLVGTGRVEGVAWQPETGALSDVALPTIAGLNVVGTVTIGLVACPSGPVTEGGIVFALQHEDPLWLWLETEEG